MIRDGPWTNILFIEWTMVSIFHNELIFAYELLKIKEM
jgi:hypothetical protein